MIIQPEKIDPTSNEAKATARQTLETHPDLRRLINILFNSGIFGASVKNIPDIAGEIYLHVPTANQGKRDTRINGVKEDWNSKGKVRIGNLKSKSNPKKVTQEEAEHFHYYFSKLFGDQWGNIISPEELVAQPLSQTITKAFAQGLPWPVTLPSRYALQAMFQSYKTPHFEIGIKIAGKRVFRRKNDKPQEIHQLDSRPVYAPEEEFSIALKGMKATKNRTLFIFEGYDLVSMQIDDDSEDKEVFDLLPQFLTYVDSETMDLRDENGQRFIFESVLGGFSLFAITYPSTWNFDEKFGVSPNNKRWCIAEGEIFLNNLHHAFLSTPDLIDFTALHYRVA